MYTLLNPIVSWIAVAGLVLASYGAAYWKGRQDGWDKREEIALRDAREAEKILARVAAVRAKVTKEVVTVYRDRIKLVEKDREVLRETFIPDSCKLSNDWVRLHNAAAGFPDTATGVDGTSEASTAAEVVANNYLACRENTEKLISLQSWITKQSKTK